MITPKTFNNALKLLRDIGDSHMMIYTTSVGDIYELDLEKHTEFPLFHINPLNVDINESTMTMNFQLFICDIVTEDTQTEEDVLSDTLQIVTDILSLLRNETYEGFFTEGNYTVEPFTERFDNSLSGWVVNVPIIVDNDYQSCDLPIA
tara:strand:- start:9130 stop:9573 length:444 start_codon:yes stop_codon:yes gene_type:complete